MSKPVSRSVVVAMSAGVAPGEVPRLVAVFPFRVAPAIIVMAMVFFPVTPVPVVVAMPRAIVHGMVAAMMVAPFPTKDFVQLPPGQSMIVTQRRAVIPEVESPVVPEPPRHMPVTIDDRVVMSR